MAEIKWGADCKLVKVSTFSPEELARYSRHMILPQIGAAGQRKLKEARVLLVGAGGLGSPAALYLAAAGIGELGVVDFDRVDLSNLHRQVLHATNQVGQKKTDSAESAIHEINPNVHVSKFDTVLTSANALEILEKFDLVVDGTDNFSTRYLVNDACVLLKKPNVYGSIFRFDGQASVLCAPNGPCYRCLFPEPPPPGMVPSCADAGVLGILPGIVGLIQATEAIKLVLGLGESLIGRLLLYEALEMRFREVRIERDPACPICGDHPTVHSLIDYDQFCGVPPRTNEMMEVSEIDPAELIKMMDEREVFELIDVREPDEFEEDRIDGSVLIPLGTLPEALDRLSFETPLIIHCRSGGRSRKACEFLLQNGYTRVSNLRGGILAWNEATGSSPQ